MQPSIFSNLPFKRKILLLIAGIAGGSLLLFSVLSVLNLSYTLQAMMVERTEKVSKLIVAQSIPKLSLPRGAEPDRVILSILETNRDIEVATIYGVDDVEFLTYVNLGNTSKTVLPESVLKEREKFFFQNGKIKFQTFQPIQLKGKSLGTLYILSNTNELISHLYTSIFLTVLSFLVSLGVVLVVAFKLQKNISQPVLTLADSARKVAELGDYSIRAESSTKDEVGDLITNFNLILEVIQLRDEQLKEHKKNLDFLVGQRTEEFLRRQDDATAEPTVKNDFPTKIRNERRTPLSRLVDNHMSHIYSDLTPDVRLIGKALIVDDEPINRKVVVEILRKFGLEMEVAQNGIEAVQMLEANEYPLILMDIHMPEKTGFEATKEIRALEKRSERERATIIAITADVAETTQKKCFDVGMDDFLSKPIKPEILIDRIAHWLGAGKDRTTTSAAESSQKKTRNVPEPGLWNRSRALEFVGGDEALFCEIATVFIGRNDLLLQNIAAAIAHRNADDLLEAAHAYKGAIGYFASQVLRKSAIALEEMAQKGQVDGVDVHLTQLQENSQLLCSDLYQMVLEKKSR